MCHSITNKKMSYNKILSKKTVGTIVKNGKEITISVATRTEKWMRPDVAVDAIADPFTEAVDGFTGNLPENTKDICAREAQHTSQDPRDHFTGVCFDSKNQGKSVHFPIKK
ncbi:hypothetical protein BDV25DRAFT_43552 [Aspergillus avenaceus]|uniref:Uncharacterized protein n=1 Tax=Aspergillus avenaceus TaxID=36643 RepID=A0A5N6TKQ9_ASPAV|nr:hypothetical protein BDV25DRAFT_43552 [Aspergillus avenaceus]